MDVKTIIIIFCIVDIILGLWCFSLSIQNMRMEKAEREFKKGNNKNGK